MQQKKAVREKIYELTKGVVNTVTDLVLLELMVIGDLVSGPPTMRRALDQIQKHFQFLEERGLRIALSNAKTRGWINQKGLITELGKIKINSKIPHSQQQTKWSGTWLLAAFDIPEKQRGARNIFRSYLKEKKFGKLQESVWISPYVHYRSEVENLRKTYGLEPFVYTILSKSIGEIPAKKLAEKVWGLNALNAKYIEYLQEYSGAKVNRLAGITSFLDLLRRDPQLPYELLPAEWQGREATQLYLHIFERRPS